MRKTFLKHNGKQTLEQQRERQKKKMISGKLRFRRTHHFPRLFSKVVLLALTKSLEGTMLTQEEGDSNTAAATTGSSTEHQHETEADSTVLGHPPVQLTHPNLYWRPMRMAATRCQMCPAVTSPPVIQKAEARCLIRRRSHLFLRSTAIAHKHALMSSVCCAWGAGGWKRPGYLLGASVVHQHMHTLRNTCRQPLVFHGRAQLVQSSERIQDFHCVQLPGRWRSSNLTPLLTRIRLWAGV
ncbi:uncharacterized protein LOC130173594 [Seriola aureovittata]|uniref:uncharacterized protein LOC130173594 n=1 Tax=Seriola aureovittata TaxID=2871759 RepID=UPI0024BD916F|nr:uncharacterized protein LOC130173594 [Seriola aureovittata]